MVPRAPTRGLILLALALLASSALATTLFKAKLIVPGHFEDNSGDSGLPTMEEEAADDGDISLMESLQEVHDFGKGLLANTKASVLDHGSRLVTADEQDVADALREVRNKFSGQRVLERIEALPQEIRDKINVDFVPEGLRNKFQQQETPAQDRLDKFVNFGEDVVEMIGTNVDEAKMGLASKFSGEGLLEQIESLPEEINQKLEGLQETFQGLQDTFQGVQTPAQDRLDKFGGGGAIFAEIKAFPEDVANTFGNKLNGPSMPTDQNPGNNFGDKFAVPVPGIHLKGKLNNLGNKFNLPTPDELHDQFNNLNLPSADDVSSSFQNAGAKLLQETENLAGEIHMAEQSFKESLQDLTTGTVALNSKVVAPLFGIGSKVAAPIVGLSSKLAAPLVFLGTAIANPLLKGGAKVAAPFVKLGQIKTEGLVERSDSFFNELKDAVKPLSSATEPLHKATQPLHKAAQLGLAGVNLQAEVDKVKGLEKDLKQIENAGRRFVATTQNIGATVLSKFFPNHSLAQNVAMMSEALEATSDVIDAEDDDEPITVGEVVDSLLAGGLIPEAQAVAEMVLAGGQEEASSDEIEEDEDDEAVDDDITSEDETSEEIEPESTEMENDDDNEDNDDPIVFEGSGGGFGGGEESNDEEAAVEEESEEEAATVEENNNEDGDESEGIDDKSLDIDSKRKRRHAVMHGDTMRGSQRVKRYVRYAAARKRSSRSPRRRPRRTRKLPVKPRYASLVRRRRSLKKLGLLASRGKLAKRLLVGIFAYKVISPLAPDESRVIPFIVNSVVQDSSLFDMDAPTEQLLQVRSSLFDMHLRKVIALERMLRQEGQSAALATRNAVKQIFEEETQIAEETGLGSSTTTPSTMDTTTEGTTMDSTEATPPSDMEVTTEAPVDPEEEEDVLSRRGRRRRSLEVEEEEVMEDDEDDAMMGMEDDDDAMMGTPGKRSIKEIISDKIKGKKPPKPITPILPRPRPNLCMAGLVGMETSECHRSETYKTRTCSEAPNCANEIKEMDRMQALCEESETGRHCSKSCFQFQDSVGGMCLECRTTFIRILNWAPKCKEFNYCVLKGAICGKNH